MKVGEYFCKYDIKNIPYEKNDTILQQPDLSKYTCI